jgi:nitrogen fixation protein NifB
VKVNTIIVPGLNDHHVQDIAEKMAASGVDLLNLMPMYPNVDTPFAEIPEPTPALMSGLQQEAAKLLPQMRHCTRCRADAVGLLEEDRSQNLHGCLSACAALPPPLNPDRPYVAVATREGALVNLHLGAAPFLQIWGQDPDRGFTLIEERTTPPPGSPDRWWALAETLKDCRAVLVSAIGETPRAILKESGVMPLEVSGVIDMALQAVYDGNAVELYKARRGGLGKACTGNKEFAGGCF